MTGAVDKIDSKSISALQVNTIGEALQGQIPNLNVDISDGRPGRAASFNIRGTTSINGGSPLIIIDEVASTAEELNNISPKDIEDISVLKDAASAAIYGARGTYGVILVTTKRAKAGELKINYTNNFGWGKASRVIDLYNAPDYASIINTFASNIGQGYYTAEQVAYFENPGRIHLFLMRNMSVELMVKLFLEIINIIISKNGFGTLLLVRIII